MKIYLILFLHFTVSILFSQEVYPKRELRGTWIATVKNIDWPSSDSISSGEQIAELVNIFNKLKEAGINSVFFQVRTECDAFYNSSIEPWSFWLTGEQGKSPEPFFDPLEFAITEAHNRGMEIHAWLNPYRAILDTELYPQTKTHITNTHPDWILKFGKMRMLNPGLPEVREYIVKVVDEIISKYDVDGIHFDDYFYPYTPIKDEDTLTFATYKGDFKDINFWRRNNINTMISDVYAIINKKKPWIKFGVSPFGIIKNSFAGTTGFEAYNVLYSDPLTWLTNKTVDYIAPQLYWEIGHKSADFCKLLPWWNSIADERDLFIGLYASKFSSADYAGDTAQLGNQLRLSRKFGNVKGDVFFSAKTIFLNYSGLADSMKYNWFKYPALPPIMEWKQNDTISPPENFSFNIDSSGVKLNWSAPSDRTAKYYLLYRFSKNEPIDISNPAKILKLISGNIYTYTDDNGNEEFIYAITSLNRLFFESKLISLSTSAWKKDN